MFWALFLEFVFCDSVHMCDARLNTSNRSTTTYPLQYIFDAGCMLSAFIIGELATTLVGILGARCVEHSSCDIT